MSKFNKGVAHAATHIDPGGANPGEFDSSDAEMKPLKRLYRAMLTRAIDDWLEIFDTDTVSALGGTAKFFYEDGWALADYLFTSDPRYDSVFSFENVCDVSGLDLSCIRALLLDHGTRGELWMHLKHRSKESHDKRK